MFLKEFLLSACLGLVFIMLVESQQEYGGLMNEIREVENFSLLFLLRVALDIDDNVAACPLSVWTMLTVLSEGTQGQTLEELSAVLRHPKTGDKTVWRQIYKVIEKTFLVNTLTVKSASINQFFVDVRHAILPQYENLLLEYNIADISKVDFRDTNTVNYINQMISRDARGKITDLIHRINLANETMILMNSVFFKGQWSSAFNPSLTKVENFYNSENQIVGKVNMMYQRGIFPYRLVPEFEAHVLELPYGTEKRFSMIIMMPYNHKSLVELILKFNKFRTREMLESLENAATATYDRDEEVDVYLPRFNIVSDLNLNSIIGKMGAYDVFDSNRSDLSGISNEGRLFLSQIIHKVHIEVNEEGIASSTDSGDKLSYRKKNSKVVINRPFLYMIYEKIMRISILAGTYKTPSLV